MVVKGVKISKPVTYVLASAVVLTLGPLLVSQLWHPERLGEFLIVVASSALYAFGYAYMLTKQPPLWVQAIVTFFGWTMTIGFIILFTPTIGNSYLVLMIALQIVFSVQGPRFGIVMAVLDLLAVILIAQVRGTQIFENVLFALCLLATAGALSWIFYTTSNSVRAEAEENAEKAHRLADEISDLNRLLLASHQDERRRLARDIHDGPLQSMAVQILTLDRLQRRMENNDTAGAMRELEDLRTIGRDTVDELRTTVNSLHNTLLDVGIIPALQNLARRNSTATGLTITVHNKAEVEPPGELQICVYQLAQEGLNNVKKHAQARNVSITLTATSREVQLIIADDGKGFDYIEKNLPESRRGHLGLYIMRERTEEQGGTMSIHSAPNKGTRITFTFPVSLPPEELATAKARTPATSQQK